MFERYTERARRVLFFARYEATQHGAAAIGPEHLLMGLLRDGSAGGTSRLFENAGISLESIRAGLASVMERSAGKPPLMEIPFTAATKKVLEFAAEEADALVNRDITPRHLLLGILREAESEAARLLTRLGLQLDTARTAASQIPGGEPDRPAAPPHAGLPPRLVNHQREAIPPSSEVRVSISTRHGTSSSRGPRHWFLEGFSFINAIATIFGFPASRIECREGVARERPYDLFLMLPALPMDAPHPNLERAMRSAVERHFAVAVSKETRPTSVLVLTAPDGSIRSRQISPIDVGGISTWTTEWTEESHSGAPLTDDTRRQHFEAHLRMFTGGRGMAPPPGSTIGPSAFAGSLTMPGLCEMLESALGQPVVDETALSGTFELEVRADSPNVDDVSAALRDRLGLALTPGEREVTFLVVTPA